MLSGHMGFDRWQPSLAMLLLQVRAGWLPASEPRARLVAVHGALAPARRCLLLRDERDSLGVLVVLALWRHDPDGVPPGAVPMDNVEERPYQRSNLVLLAVALAQGQLTNWETLLAVFAPLACFLEQRARARWIFVHEHGPLHIRRRVVHTDGFECDSALDNEVRESAVAKPCRMVRAHLLLGRRLKDARDADVGERAPFPDVVARHSVHSIGTALLQVLVDDLDLEGQRVIREGHLVDVHGVRSLDERRACARVDRLINLGAKVARCRLAAACGTLSTPQ
mmetsp:Transcript_8859/g.23129  ORF Transcript_8859/g.23129 Transcript_8859/m.23129 type:complete len:281 (-) Transcript_8859:873-1715(-)